MNFSVCIQTNTYVIQVFLWSRLDLFFSLVHIVIIVIRVQKFWCFPRSTYFLFLVSRISSTALLKMALFSCCLLISPLGTGLLPRSLVGLLLSYLVTNSPRTLHSSKECQGPWMRKIGFGESTLINQKIREDNEGH